jgi:hypothetical protein
MSTCTKESLCCNGKASINTSLLRSESLLRLNVWPFTVMSCEI